MVGAMLSRALAVAVLSALAVALGGCAGAELSTASGGRLLVVGAESQYANVPAQVGARYVSTVALERNPNTDPHTFEASPSVAEVLSEARLVVQNGVGYDTFMERIESASGGVGSNSTRKVIDVQKLLGLPGSTLNPHLWYK